MSDTAEAPLPPQQPLTKEALTTMVTRWLEYARTHLTLARLKNAQIGEVRQRVIEAGYGTEESAKEADELISKIAGEEVVKEQINLLEINKQRLITLVHLTGRKKPHELKGTTVVSIGGGPGDGICEPWFPRVASIAGAHVINFDYSDPNPLDAEMKLYEHRGNSSGDVFQLLLNNSTLREVLAARSNISIIECNNLIGLNVSPSLATDLKDLKALHGDHPKIIDMRNNLRQAAADLLMENGVLAIDNAYQVKRGGKLIPVDENGQERHTSIFPEEQISST